MPYIQKTYKGRIIGCLSYFTKLKDALIFGENWESIDVKNNRICLANRGFLIIYENLKV